MKYRAWQYSYLILWDEEQRKYNGKCLEFMELNAPADTPEDALLGIHQRVEATMRELAAEGKRIPVPFEVEKAQLSFQNGVGLPKFRPPSHPGSILLELYLAPLNLSPKELAHRVFTDPLYVTALTDEEAPMTVDMALRLAKFFPPTSPKFWLGFQTDLDLYQAQRENRIVLRAIRPYPLTDYADDDS